MLVLNGQDIGAEDSALCDLIAGLERLLPDLRSIRDRRHPGPDILDEAPIISRWSLAMRPTICLAGLTEGHPLLPGRARPILTSDVWLIAPDAGWARTLNRFYRLVRPDNGIGE